jgi:hypothetical protein
MTDITEARTNIQTEEASFRASVSEALAFRLGQSINFINKKQHKAYDFKFLGPFRTLNGGEDGARGFIEDVEIVGISGYIRLSGSSGTTTIDLHLVRSGDQGTIFSTKLSINSTATDGVNFWKNLVNVGESSETGITNPVFSTTNLNQGDVIRCDVDSNATGAYDLTVNIHYRPR